MNTKYCIIYSIIYSNTPRKYFYFSWINILHIKYIGGTELILNDISKKIILLPDFFLSACSPLYCNWTLTTLFQTLLSATARHHIKCRQAGWVYCIKKTSSGKYLVRWSLYRFFPDSVTLGCMLACGIVYSLCSFEA